MNSLKNYNEGGADSAFASFRISTRAGSLLIYDDRHLMPKGFDFQSRECDCEIHSLPTFHQTLFQLYLTKIQLNQSGLFE